MDSAGIGRSFKPGSKDVANSNSMVSYAGVPGVRGSDPFQGTLLVRTGDDPLFDFHGIFLTLREHDGTNGTPLGREAALSPGMELNKITEGRVSF